MEYTQDFLSRLTVRRLQIELRKRNLLVSGKKKDLIDRILTDANSNPGTNEGVSVPVVQNTEPQVESNGLLHRLILLETIHLDRLREENSQTRFWVRWLCLTIIVCLVVIICLIINLLPENNRFNKLLN